MGRRDRNNSADFVRMSPPPVITDGGGHAFLMVDPSSLVSSTNNNNNNNSNNSNTTMTTPRWGRRRGILRKAQSSPDCPRDLGHLEEPLRRLSFTDKELQQVIEDPEQFRMLQCQLREQGAVTNSMLKEGIHFYVQTCLEDKQQRLIGQSLSLSSEADSSSPPLPKLITPPSVTSSTSSSSGSGSRRFGFRTSPTSS